MDLKSSRRVATERRYGGNLLIVVAIVVLTFNTSWGDAAAITFAVIGIGFRIEAAIAFARISQIAETVQNPD
jgi:hypothetical protein